MNVDILTVGALDTNCYLIYNDNNKCLVVDPGDDENFIMARIKELSLDVIGILITHDHADHTKYAESFKNMYGVEIYDYNSLFEGINKIEDFTFYTLYTPGHTKSSVTFYFEEYNSMFVGDFIFKDGIGRVDMPTGSFKEMVESINKIKTYPDETIIYPGHGDITTLEYEKEHNKYFI